MARPDKVAAVAELKEKFSSADATVLTEYRGLSVSALKDLRRSLGSDATALAFINGDVASVAKGLKNFAKDNPLLVIKGGVMDGNVLDADQVKKLADLESREVLLAKLAGGLKANLTKAAVVFNALPSKAARGLGALQEKAAADPSVIGGAGEASDQEPKTTETPEASAAQDNTNE